jgi:hypothetical protein
MEIQGEATGGSLRDRKSQISTAVSANLLRWPKWHHRTRRLRYADAPASARRKATAPTASHKPLGAARRAQIHIERAALTTVISCLGAFWTPIAQSSRKWACASQAALHLNDHSIDWNASSTWRLAPDGIE